MSDCHRPQESCDGPGCSDFKSLACQLAEAQEKCRWLEAERQRLYDACSKQNAEIEQTLGKVLGYPWFKDDQKSFPGATEADGVCVGEHVAESLADEAASRIRWLEGRLAAVEKALEWTRDADAASDDRFWELGYESAIEHVRLALLPPKGTGDE